MHRGRNRISHVHPVQNGTHSGGMLRSPRLATAFDPRVCHSAREAVTDSLYPRFSISLYPCICHGDTISNVHDDLSRSWLLVDINENVTKETFILQRF